MSHKLRNSVKVLVNVKSNDNERFLWCHIMHLNLSKTLRKSGKEMVNDLAYEGIKLSASKKDYSKIEEKTVLTLMYFVLKMISLILFIY